MEKADMPANASPKDPDVLAAPSAQIRRRDDFKAATKRLLALRVGYLCSNPECQRPTVGPKKGGSGYVSTGIAAHIKAAAPEGPRYDPSQTVLERSAFENGLWLCADHAHIIDHDEEHFTTELLLEWKRGAEERAFRRLVGGHGHAVLNASDDLVEELRGLRSLLGLPEEQDLDWIRARTATGALAQIEAFEAAPAWPRHPVNLELAFTERDRVEAMDISRFPQVILALQKVVLISGPGTGKTTTLLQAARFMMAEGIVPLFVPLGEWAEGGSDLWGWLIGRHGYEGLNANHMKILAHHGELVLFLDGWNEVPASSRRRLIKELDGMQRDFPLLNIVMSSRRESLEMPLKGRRLDVLPLSDTQQADIARGLKGDAGARVLDAAWRTSGLRELVSIPLYLRSLLAISDAGKLPETKEEVLRRMVDAHEAEPANADLFSRELFGFQRRYLSALATLAQRAERATLPAKEARAAVAAVNRIIIEDGETSASPNAQDVLSKLVDAHSLVQNEELFGFQHQQILEWFASLDLEVALRASKTDLSLNHPIVIEILNEAAWAETVLFASERMSRSDATGVRAIAAVVEILLKIDPSFAAAIIRRSGPALWELVSRPVSSFARAWHAYGQVDRAIAFMIDTGQAEFADIVWPLVANQDGQVQSHTIRLVRRFNPSVLGDLLKRKYCSLPDKTRASLLGELAYHGDSTGMDAALELALSEPSTATRYEAFAGLSFRGATTRIEELLRKSGDELAEMVAERGYLDAIHDDWLLADLERRKQKLAASRSPEDRLLSASRFAPDATLREVIVSTLQDYQYSFRDHGAYALAEAARRLPEAVAAALRWRLENGFDLPFRPFGYLEAEAPTDSGRLPEMLLNGDVAGDAAKYASFLVGPETIKRLLESLLAAWREFRVAGLRTEVAYAPVRKLHDILESTRAPVLFEALQFYSADCAPAVVADLCYVIASHGRNHDREDLPITAEQRERAVVLLNGWGRQLLNLKASRQELGALARVMRRLAHPSQVSILADMLNADLAALSTAKAVFRNNRRDDAARQEIRSSYSHEYRLSLTEAGTPEAEGVLAAHLEDPEFGVEAAIGLQMIWQQRNEPRIKKAYHPWPDFERAMANRSRDRGTSTVSAEAILRAAKRAKSDGTGEGLRRALKFAGCAALLPHGQRMDFYVELICADVDPRSKLDLANKMLVGGLMVPASVIRDALKQTLDARAESKWISEDQFGDIIDWIKLLPFSDKPDDTLTVLDFLDTKIKVPWIRIRDILSIVRHKPEGERIQLLRGFVQRFPELAAQHELYMAMQNPRRITLDFLVELASGKYGRDAMSRGTPYDYPQTLYAALPPEERERLLDRFNATDNQRIKEFVASVLLAGGDHESFLKLACDIVGRRVIARAGWNAQQYLLYDHQPIGEATNQFELIPRDLRRLREGLFDLTASDDVETRAFASEYLNKIDEERDKEGGIDAGPRHPNIASRRAWPEIMGIGNAK
ncbi:hypothetical protein [Rhizobium sp. MHM7A]|uniref:NACHT domain-containing protein n=1 Tax=Rhizobium sp. MHM7A TaxID=2583233 RepID=UPI001106F54D|nr:hypothetical protein [Rhizobium sp. MHM7A]TLX08598.1 hypothetical protein FFR93_29445 [Rhizobium sp. MHM7A]